MRWLTYMVGLALCLATALVGETAGFPMRPSYKCSSNGCFPIITPAFRDYKCPYPDCKTFGDYTEYKHGRHFPADEPGKGKHHHKHEHHHKHGHNRPMSMNPNGYVSSESVHRRPDGSLITPGSDKVIIGYGDATPNQGYAGPPQEAQRGFPPPKEPMDTKWGGYFPNYGSTVKQEPDQPIALPFAPDAPASYEVPPATGYWFPTAGTNQ